jgi:hypothetical protein
MSDELLLAILKAFVPQVNEHQSIGFHVCAYIRIFISPVIQSEILSEYTQYTTRYSLTVSCFQCV